MSTEIDVSLVEYMVFIKKKHPDLPLIDLKLSSLKKIFQSGLIVEMKVPDFFSEIMELSRFFKFLPSQYYQKLPKF